MIEKILNIFRKFLSKIDTKENEMKQVDIIRIEYPKVPIEDQTKATVGIMRIEGKFFCFTLEPPDRNNEKDSSIPIGEYLCKRYSSPRYKDTFEVTNVPNRSYILIHSGNTDKDSTGCCIIGSSQGFINGKRAVLNSRITFKKFMKKMKNEKEFKLKIIKV